MIYFLIRFISLINKASMNIAVKNRLNEGINIGNQSFWNKLYKLEFPLTLSVKLIRSKIEPAIKKYRL